MITADYHVHSSFSSDSDTPMEAMIEKAISLGMTRICFTDHMDYDFPKKYELTFQFDVDDYFEKLDRLSERYKDRIRVLKGIELGMMTHLGERYDKLLSDYPFDFVIASTHLIDGIDPYYAEFWENRTSKEGLQRYFDSILENIACFQNFDVYGHLDYISRYAPDKGSGFVMEDFQEVIDRILKALISYGKGIEVNTAGYKYGMGHPNPHEDIIRRYLELGGTVLTIGSDGHMPEHFAYDFERAERVLKELGVSGYSVFEKRKAMIVPFS
jgi:histidinol-phosphatase (PHP family)